MNVQEPECSCNLSYLWGGLYEAVVGSLNQQTERQKPGRAGFLLSTENRYLPTT